MWRFLLVLAACTSSPPKSYPTLAELRGKAGINVENLGTQVDGYLDTSAAHCQSLDPLATVEVDGPPVALQPAVYTSVCFGMPFLGYVHGKTLVVSDPTDTWTIALPGFDAAGEPMLSLGALTAGTTATATWPGGPALNDGCVTLAGATKTYDSCDPANLAVQFSGNQVSFEVPADLTGNVDVTLAVGGWLTLPGVAAAERGTGGCDGPRECKFSLWGRVTRQGVAIAP